MVAKMAPTSKILRSNFGLQLPMLFRRAYGELRDRTRGPRWRRWWLQAGEGGSDRTRLWRDLEVISYAVHQSRTDAADPITLRVIPATVPLCGGGWVRKFINSVFQTLDNSFFMVEVGFGN